MKIHEKYLTNEEINMNRFFNDARMGKTPDMTAISGAIMDWAFDVLEVVEASGDKSYIKTARQAVDNLQKTLKNVEVKKNMVEKIASRFR